MGLAAFMDRKRTEQDATKCWKCGKPAVGRHPWSRKPVCREHQIKHP